MTRTPTATSKMPKCAARSRRSLRSCLTRAARPSSWYFGPLVGHRRATRKHRASSLRNATDRRIVHVDAHHVTNVAVDRRHHQPHGSPKSDTKGSPARAVGDKGIHKNGPPHVRWMFATRRIGPVDSATPGHRGPVDSRYGAGNGWQTLLTGRVWATKRTICPIHLLESSSVLLLRVLRGDRESGRWSWGCPRVNRQVNACRRTRSRE